MKPLQEIIGLVLIIIGLLFMLIGSIGIIRLPDFFARTHASSKVDTVGISVVLAGIAVLEGFERVSGKALLASAFLIFTNPVAAHALARAAFYKGLKPWQRGNSAPKTPTPANDAMAD